jgi:hypothetical protein
MPRYGAYDKQSSKGETKKCLDCPSLIPAYGGKVRCMPCSSFYSDKLKAERGKRNYLAKKAKQEAKAAE